MVRYRLQSLGDALIECESASHTHQSSIKMLRLQRSKHQLAAQRPAQKKMSTSMGHRLTKQRGVFTAVLLLALALCAHAHQPKNDARLSKIGPAPDIELTDQNGQLFSLAKQRGKVTVVTFIYASCTDTCPLLTAKMVGMQKKLGKAFGSRVYFVSVTVDPERDTAQVLRQYGEAQGANFSGWAFLTGSPVQVQDVT